MSLVGLIFWEATIWIDGVAEPWDGHNYLAFYVTGLLLSGLAGYVAPSLGWFWGAVLMMMQLPIMLIHSQPGPLIGVGILMLLVMSAPAMLVSAVAGLIAQR